MNNNPNIAYLFLINDGKHFGVMDMAAEYIASKYEYDQSKVLGNLEYNGTNETYGYKFIFHEPITKQRVACSFSDYMVSIGDECKIDSDWIYRIYKKLDEYISYDYIEAVDNQIRNTATEQIRKINEQTNKLNDDINHMLLGIYKPDEEDSSSESER